MVRDYGWIQLPFSGDGDLQEIFYHLNCEAWYRKERALLADHVRLGDTVVDVGANIGFMTAIFHELIGPTGKIYAFEPSLRVFRKLKRVIAVNGLTNAEPINSGCGSEPSTATLYQISGSSGNASLVPAQPECHARDAEQVDLVRLDDVFQADRPVDFIKVDTEGYESVVLQGAIDLLERDQPTLYIELSQEYEESSREATHLLQELGYEFMTEPDLWHAHNGDNFLAIHSAKRAPTQ